MRKLLLFLVIVLLIVLLFFIGWQDIPNLEMITTYQEIQKAYSDYEKNLKILKNKNEVELPNTTAKLNPEYEATDTDNVVKQYKDNKKNYDDLVAYQKANASIGAADIYDVEYIWTNIGVNAAKNYCNMTMDITKSEADLESEDYIMCNLEFEVVGQYSSVAQFIEDIEKDINLGFQINDFFIEGYSGTARNQNKETTMDTNNIPTEKSQAEGSEYSVSSYSDTSYSGSSDGSTVGRHELDIKSSFKVYNVPLNRRTITNVKSAAELTTPTTEEGTGEEAVVE